MPYSANPLIAPAYSAPAGDPYDHRVPVVSLVQSGHPISDGVRLHHNRDRYGYILGPEAEGLGVAPVELQSAPLAGGGSVFRHARLTEGEVFLPITLSAASPSQLPDMFDRLVQLVRPGRGTFYDIVVFDPYGQETRTRQVVFESGLTDPVRVSPRVWKTSLTGRYMDPFWYGRERILSRRLGAISKKFITAYEGDESGAGGYEFPFFPVLVGGSTIQNEYELTIQGDAPAYWDAVIRGPGRDFTLRNQNGEGIFIAGDIDESVVIVNRPQQQDITLADGTPIWERLDTGKGHDDFFLLEPGKNVLQITMVNATAESEVAFRYREAFYHSIGGDGR